MEILLFIITRPILATWWARAIIVAVAASAVLNICPFLPWLKDIKPSRIWARWTGYAGLTATLAIWTVLTGKGWIEFSAWIIITVATLIPNTLVHLRAESIGDDSTDDRAKDTRVFEIKLSEDGAALFEQLLKDRVPVDAELGRLFKLEQQRETAKERWESVLMPRELLGLLDEAIVCATKAMKEQNENWLLTAIASVQEARNIVCKKKDQIHLWYKLFWPEHAA